MKILHVTNLGIGGAGIAAYRLHTALRKVGVDSRMLVRRKGTNDPTVAEVGSFVPVDGCSLIVDEERPQQPIIRQRNNCWARLPVRARGWLGAKLTKILGMEGCSLNIFPTGLHKVLNASDADVIHLHWINNEMISIKEIAKIKKPIIWTLHDCWPLLGAEHHSSSDYWKVSHTAEPTEGRQALQRQSNERSEWQRRGWRGATAMNEVSGNKHKKEIFQQPLPLEDVRGGQRGHPKTEISGRSSACNKQCPESSGQPCCTGVDSAHNGSLKTGFREAVLRRIATVYSSFLRVPSRSFAVKRNLLCLTRLFTRTTEGSGCKKSSSMLHTPCSWLSGVVNRYIFGLKKRAWKQLHVSFIAPSNWMAEQVKKSELFTDAPVTVIPNCLDLDVFKPLEQSECRKKLGLPLDKKLILFGAFNPFDPNKGLDLLEEALNKLPEEARRCVGVVVFGLRPGGAYAPEGCEGERKIGGLETYWMGSVGSEQEMAAVYNAGDCTCVPSRRESFGYTAAESLACGIPVAAFRTSGLVDIVDHQETGWLAEPYDPEDLSRGIFWVLAGNPALSAACRRKAEAMLSPEAVVRSHSLIYSDLITLTDNRNLRFQ